MTLVIMAAGMGSRFGGLKQIEPVGPNGEFIIDYSIYDAIKAGFDKVVFIIKEENYEIFKSTIGKRIEDVVKVEYVFQDIKNVPDGVKIPEDRVKPLGTGHALYCATKAIDEPFAVISADDFYGREPFKLLTDSLKNGEYSIIGYEIGNTLTLNGSVKRGVCFEKEGNVEKIVESKVERVDGKIVCEPLSGEAKYEVEENHPVSMLMYGIQKEFCEFLKNDIIKYFKNFNGDLSTFEYLLPDALNNYLNESNKELKLIKTSSIWKGITYSSDLEELKEYINELIQKGEYPSNLYQKK